MAIFTASYDDEMEDWERELTRKDGHPLIATAIGAVAILVVGVGAISRIGIGVSVAGAAGVASAVALLVWAIACGITIRHANLAWKIGSFLLLWISALAMVLIGVGSARQATREDMRAFAEVRVDREGNIFTPPARGPISRLGFTFFRSMAAESGMHEQAVKKLGFDRLRQPDELVRDPSLLRHCDQISLAGPMIDASFERRRTIIVQFRSKLSALQMDQEFRDTLLRGFDKGMGATSKLFQRGAENEHQQIAEVAALCSILARRNWRPQHGKFGFTSNADLASFNQHGARLDALLREIEQTQETAQAEMREGQDMIRQAFR